MKKFVSLFTFFAIAISAQSHGESKVLSCTGLYDGKPTHRATFTIEAEKVPVGEGEMTDRAVNQTVIGQYEVVFEGRTAEGTNEATVTVTDTQSDNTSTATAIGENPGDPAVVNFDIRGASAVNLNIMCVYK